MSTYLQYFKEVRVILKTVTFRRLSNLFILYLSHFISKLLKRNYHKGRAAFLTLETTNSCNLSCPECVTGMNDLKRPTTWMTADFAQTILEQTSKHVWVTNLYFQGEPLLNPELPEIIQHCTKHRQYSILSTNAQNLDAEKADRIVKNGLKKIIISLDGFTQETYEKYRIRGKIEKVFEGINNLVEARKKHKSAFPIIEVQFLVFSFNEHEISKARKHVLKMGCDRFVTKTAQFYNPKRAEEWAPSRKYSRYISTNKLITNNTSARGCKKMWTSAVVCSGGEMALCCMDKNAVYSPGKIDDTNMKQLWDSTKLNNLRTRIITGDYPEICTNCPLKG